jgi:hypothetical protein
MTRFLAASASACLSTALMEILLCGFETVTASDSDVVSVLTAVQRSKIMNGFNASRIL